MSRLGVYALHCAASNTFYVGETANRRSSRHAQHLNYLAKQKHPSQHLQSAWNKHGPSQFSFSWLWICTDAASTALSSGELSAITRAAEAEIGNRMIDEECHMFNMAAFNGDGKSNPTCNKDIAEKVSLTHKSLWADAKYRKRQIEAMMPSLLRKERRDAISRAQIESWSSPERTANARETTKARWADPEKRSRIIDGMRASGHVRSVICLDTSEIFDSATIASKSIGKHQNAVCRSIRDAKKCGGLTWAYV